MNNPEYAKVNNKLYKINTDFKVALRCNEVYNSNASEKERVLAIIYLLFGDEGLNNPNDWDGLLEKGTKFLLCGKEKAKDNDEPSMDFKQDEGYIKASFFTDYGIANIYNTNMHWWDFCDYLNGLTENCVLNRVRYVREFDTSKLKGKELQEWKERKKEVALKKEKRKATKEQRKASDEFYNALGL